MTHRLFAVLLALAAVTLGTANAQAANTLKCATLAPKSSPWGKVFRTWAKAIEKKTKGDVKMSWHWNGTAGAEGTVVGKMRSGQLSCAAVTAVGLSAIHKPFLALQMPGAFENWGQLDRARAKVRGELASAVEAQGFFLGGFGDVGIGRVMSRGFAVRKPADLKGKKPAVIDGDTIAPNVYAAIDPSIRPVSSPVTGFLPKLNSGEINVLNTPSLAAEQLQWASKVDHINSGATYFGIGALVLSKKDLDGMSADSRAVVVKTSQLAAKALTKRIRAADEQAFGRLKKKMKVVDLTAAEKAEWKKVFKKACKRTKGAIPGGMLSKVGAC